MIGGLRLIVYFTRGSRDPALEPVCADASEASAGSAGGFAQFPDPSLWSGWPPPAGASPWLFLVRNQQK